jgi:hypothetical protein
MKVPVNVATPSVLAFLALLLAVIIIIAAVLANRRGKLSRGALICIAVLVVLLIAFGMTGGFLPRL